MRAQTRAPRQWGRTPHGKAMSRQRGSTIDGHSERRRRRMNHLLLRLLFHVLPHGAHLVALVAQLRPMNRQWEQARLA
eukprot:6746668-Pyramimonas_sp.AAC.1